MYLTPESVPCRHSFHYLDNGDLPCREDDCNGYTVACGQGSITCPRHADRIPAAVVGRGLGDVEPAILAADDSGMKYVVILTASQMRLIERALTDVITGPNRRDGIAAQSLLHGLLTLAPASESALLTETVKA